MTWHNVLISNPARLRLKHRQVLLEQEDSSVTIPLEDIASITLESHQIRLSSALLSAMAEHNISLISCDSRHTPNGLMLGFAPHSRPLAMLKMQLGTSKPLRKRLWQMVIRRKIENQAAVLTHFERGAVQNLRRLATMVDSGDSKNREAQAAVKYFAALFHNFKRHGQDRINASLNYSYAVLRADIARELTAHGFTPALGLHHCNEFNAYNLADDLIEPYRPLADAWAISQLDLLADGGSKPRAQESPLTIDDRASLTRALQMETLITGERHTMQSNIRLCVKSLVSAFSNKRTNDLLLPTLALPIALKEMG